MGLNLKQYARLPEYYLISGVFFILILVLKKEVFPCLFTFSQTDKICAYKCGSVRIIAIQIIKIQF